MTEEYRSLNPTIVRRTGFVTATATPSIWGPTQDTVIKYINRCWHYTNSEFVRWETETDPDPTGINYPGPGTFGVDTTSPAVVESIIE